MGLWLFYLVFGTFALLLAISDLTNSNMSGFWIDLTATFCLYGALVRVVYVDCENEDI